MSNWVSRSSGSSVGGILVRKSSASVSQFDFGDDGGKKFDDLLVFGYSCKLFRDDQKALEVDQGKHLIPWMGDDSLKIDRYDGRAALSDLRPYESNFDTAIWLSGLTDAERKVELICDEERYRALNTNEDEEKMYREEELKRLHLQLSKNYGQVGFDYDNVNIDTSNHKDDAKKEIEIEEEDYVQPPHLDLPINMVVPRSMKAHARIEKTAMFIHKQGPQMEILLKTKQSGNPQFDFLSHDDSLYRYYQHILMAMKTGRYQKHEQVDKDPPKETPREPAQTGNQYLHPSLTPMDTSAPPPPVRSITYKPSADCAYTMLISKIKGKSITELSNAKENSGNSPSSSGLNTTPMSSLQKFDACFKAQINAPPANCEPQLTYCSQPLSYITEQQNVYKQGTFSNNCGNSPYFQPSGMCSTIPSQLNTHFITPVTTIHAPNALVNPTLVSASCSVTNTDGLTNVLVNAYTATKCEMNYDATIPLQCVTAHASQQIGHNVTTEQNNVPANPAIETLKSGLLSLAHYSSSSDSENEANKPPANIESDIPAAFQVIMDKMASYVARNSVEFENVVRKRNDSRFAFIEETHPYNWYYKNKLSVYRACLKKKQESKLSVNNSDHRRVFVSRHADDDSKTTVEQIHVKEGGQLSKDREDARRIRKTMAPVSFSIKTKEKPEIPIEKSVLLDEESSDDNDNNEPMINGHDDLSTAKPDQFIHDQTQFSVKTIAEVNQNGDERVLRNGDVIEHCQNELGEPKKDNNILGNESKIQKVYEMDDTTTKYDDLTRDIFADPETLSNTEDSRAKQLDRKRRAEAFLNKLRSTKSSHAYEVKFTQLDNEDTDDTPTIEIIDNAETIQQPVAEDDLVKQILDCEVIDITEDDGPDLIITAVTNAPYKCHKEKQTRSPKSNSKKKFKLSRTRYRASSSESPTTVRKRAKKHSKHKHRSKRDQSSSKEKRKHSKSRRYRSKSRTKTTDRYNYAKQSKSRSRSPACKSRSKTVENSHNSKSSSSEHGRKKSRKSDNSQRKYKRSRSRGNRSKSYRRYRQRGGSKESGEVSSDSSS